MKASILLVDDEPQLLAAMQLLLRRERFDVAVAGSGAAALALLATRRFDAVVSDEQMPGMHGTELLAQVRAAQPTALRILMTGRADLADPLDALEDGAIDRLFAKPCPSAVVIRALHEGLRLRQLAEAAALLLQHVQASRAPSATVATPPLELSDRGLDALVDALRAAAGAAPLSR